MRVVINIVLTYRIHEETIVFCRKNKKPWRYNMNNFYSPEGCLIDTNENTEHISSLAGLEYALSCGLILEARASLCDAERNLVVDLGNYKGIIPRDEVAYSPDGVPTKDIAVITRVGKPVCFKVRSVERNNGEVKIYLSRRLAQKECYENYISYLEPGDVIDARVTHMEPFGCFCDVGCGFVSLLTVDCISVSRISHPKERFFDGQFIKSVVKQIELSSGRITLSHKELLGTWSQNAQGFAAGQTAAGIVRSIEPYGIFVELTPNLAGLAEWRDDISVGQSTAVYIKSIMPEKMKIKLVIVDSGSAALKTKPKYFIEEGHIDIWEYSPEQSVKKVITEFV